MSWENAPALNKLTASQQGGNRGAQLWGVDYRGKLHTIYQKSPGGDWSNWMGSEWNGPNWLGAPRLHNIAAVEGSHGAIIFAQDEDYRVLANFQNSPGSNNWSGWSAIGGSNAPRSYELTAAGQNNRRAQVWAITLGGKLTSMVQRDENWPTQWSDKDDPPPPPKS